MLITKATPTLNKKEFKKFIEKIEKGLKNPVGLVPTPKIEEARKKVLEKFQGIKNMPVH
jgi:hypothetical protein